jgi:hypothetical protein
MTLEKKGRVICTDVYDKDGNLTKMDVHTRDDTFVMQVLWDPRDEQTSENREEFRKWAYRHLEQSGYDVE